MEPGAQGSMFTRKSKNDKGKKKVACTKRLIGGHSWKTLASERRPTRTQCCSARRRLCAQIGTESKRVPWPPSVLGAIALCEQFMCVRSRGDSQRGGRARGPRQGQQEGEHIDYFKRLNGKCMKIGYDQADECVFGAAGGAAHDGHLQAGEEEGGQEGRGQGGRGLPASAGGLL